MGEVEEGELPGSRDEDGGYGWIWTGITPIYIYIYGHVDIMDIYDMEMYDMDTWICVCMYVCIYIYIHM